MFDKIFEWVGHGWDFIKPFAVVNEWQTGSILRFGKYARTIKPGFHWKIPFAEVAYDFDTAITTVHLPTQPLTTDDDVQVSIRAIIKYEIVDVQPYLIEIMDQHDVLLDITMGAIQKYIAKSKYDDLVHKLPEAEIATAVRREVHRYGFKIHAITFTAFTKARPFMLLNQNATKDIERDT